MVMFTSLFVLLLLVAGGSGLRWSDKLREDAGPVQICSGENIQLFWNFTLDKGERVKGMVWGCQPEGKEEDVLATYVDSHFVPMSSFSGRLAHLQDGGIELSCATILESGNYSIAVTTEDAHSFLTVHRKTASVNVVDTPKTQTGEIHVTRKEESIRDVTSGEWHVQLSCGNFSDRGHPSVDVIWTTPRGEHVDSSSYQDGFFHLLLPNPLVGGNYSCNMPPSQPAVRCLPRDSRLLDTVTVEVDETAGRFALLEARQQEFLKKLSEERSRTSALEQWQEETLLNSAPVSFHTRLNGNTQLSSGSILKLPRVITNQGQGYDPSTGYFTAPMNGTYFFIATTGSYLNGQWANMNLMFEGTQVANTYLYLQNSNYHMGTCHATLYLASGQRVWLQSATSNSFFRSSITTFSGFRV